MIIFGPRSLSRAGEHLRVARLSRVGEPPRTACWSLAPNHVAAGSFSTLVLMYHGSLAVSERTLSEFLQHSGRIWPGLPTGEVELRRRDGEDLVAMTRGQNDALGTVLRLFVALGTADDRAAETVLPWLAFLSEADRAACLRELGQTATAAVVTGR